MSVDGNGSQQLPPNSYQLTPKHCSWHLLAGDDDVLKQLTRFKKELQHYHRLFLRSYHWSLSVVIDSYCLKQATGSFVLFNNKTQ